MRSLWNEADAAAFSSGALAERVYTSRLLGQDRSLVLHGGGNTSVKIREPNIFGDDEDILYVKGSGWDLETIEPAGFAPVRMDHVLRLARLDALSDVQMVQELRVAMTNQSAPAPSVETILHAVIPYRFVDHTHADALLSITNTPNGEARVRELYGDSVIVVPYVMPGFPLAKLCSNRFPQELGPQTIGVVLIKHGFLSFGDTARESYERMIQLVTMAEEYLAQRKAWSISLPDPVATKSARMEVAKLRHDVSAAAGAPMIVSSHKDERSLAFAQRDDLKTIAQQGPATPDHVIRTKRVPQLGRDVATFVAAYKDYFERNAARSGQSLQMLDPAPRVLLDQELGLLTTGRTAQDASIAADIYEHTIDIILRAVALGGSFEALSEAELFEVEYWDLEQAKLRRGGSPPMFAGEVALVTGAASGIGKATVEALMKRGAAVAGLDIDPRICGVYASRVDFVGVSCDVTDPQQLSNALDRTAEAFGGLDMVVLNAGTFGKSQRIEALELEEWQRAMRLNADANAALLSAAHPLLACAPRGGRVVINASKNVPAPGPGAAAYSASKAALTQLARVAALEWGKDRIRVNVVHPNAVFDTGIWSDDVLASRAKSYGLSVDEYKRNNVLGIDVTSRDVAEMIAEMCGPLFSRTTGAQVPIDGGNERVI
jgi:rhamnose utilization protein RhaD (predicted bifunctional aldolase and dehydrogenase)/NAD(P)-dependent dehydrogenase (short-subunit alcohol dehydrogenase family)